MPRSNFAVYSAGAVAAILSVASPGAAQVGAPPSPDAPPGEAAPPPTEPAPAEPAPAEPAPAEPVPAPGEPQTAAAPEEAATAPPEQVEPGGEELMVEEAPVTTVGEDMVVTGSRLKRTAFSSSAPVLVIKREDLQRNGFTSIGDIARQLNVAGGTSSGTGTAGGSNYENQGVQMINLRGLGANATLILVNGRRLIANGPGGALETFSNVATIPVGMVERIEILRGGASAIYGSDAVAGVVNIITRKKTDGVSAQANVVTTDTFDQQEYEGNLMAGGQNEHSSFSVGLDWYHSTPLDAADRDWTKDQYWSAIGPIGLYVPIARTPMGGTAFAPDLGYFELFPDPACPDPKGFLHNDHSAKIAELESKLAMLPPTAEERIAVERQLTAYRLGQRFQGRHPSDPSLPYLAEYKSRGWWPESVPASDPRSQQQVDWNDPNGFGCSWSYRKYRELRPEMTRISTMLSATHDLTDHLQVEFEAQYSDNRTKASLQPPVDFRDAQLRPGFAYDVDSTPWTADLMRTDGSMVPQTYTYSLWYGYPADYDAPPNYQELEAQTFRGVLAFKGDFEAVAADTIVESWDWEISGSYARSTWDGGADVFHTGAVQRALDACRLASDGTLAGSLPNTTANRQRLGCFNPYYSSVTDTALANDPTLLRKLLTKYGNRVVTELYTADALLRGDLLPLPGGQLSFAAGGQFRSETRDARYDNDTNLNQNPYGGVDDTANQRNVWSGFAELGVPIVKAVELQPAIRYENYIGLGDSLSPRVGLIVRVGDLFKRPPGALARLALRGTYARAFRAPNLAQTDPDACAYVTENIYSPRSNPDPIARGSTRTQLLNGRACGSAELGPEEATSLSGGFDWTLGNFHIESDYWHYDYSERIIQPSLQTAIDKNANLGYCLIDPNANLATQGTRGRAFVATLPPAAQAGYFEGLDCAAIAEEEGVPEKSLTPDEFIARYSDVMYVAATGNPEQGSAVIHYANASEVVTRGIDVGLSYSLGGRDLGLSADIGTLTIGLQGTYVFDFKYRELPASDSVDCDLLPDDPTCEKDAAGKRNVSNFNDVIPHLKFSLPVTYANGKHQFSVIARYIGGFSDDGQFYDPFDPPPLQVPSLTTFDVQYALNLSDFFGTPVIWRIGAQNVFDQDPPRVRQRDAGGYEQSVHDGRGRLLYTRLGVDL
jgi:outer membrane receptor protein involved in Fe transport